MSSEWPLVPLEALADEVTVGFVGTMADQYVEAGIPFLRSLNIEPFAVKKTDLKCISPEFHAKLKKSALRTGDVAIVRTGKPGTCAVIPEWLGEANCSDLVLVRCGPRLRPEFLSYWVNAAAANHIAANLVGAVQQHFNVSAAKRMLVACPPLAVQDNLIELVASINDRITLLRETNATLEAIAQALFKSWFVDFDPVRAKMEGRTPEGMDEATAALFPDGFETSELGEVPRGWRVCAVEEFADRVGMGPFGSNIKVETFVESGIPVISGQHLKQLLVEDNTFNFITHEHAARLAKSCVQAGDLIFTHAGSIGQVSLLHKDAAFTSYVLSQRQFFLRCNTEVMSPEWIALYFKSPAGQHQLLANTSQVGVPSIARPVSYLRSIRLVVPPPELTQRFASIAGAINDRVMANRKQFGALTQIRDTLLPRLISGQLRLPEAQAATEAALGGAFQA